MTLPSFPIWKEYIILVNCQKKCQNDSQFTLVVFLLLLLYRNKQKKCCLVWFSHLQYVEDDEDVQSEDADGSETTKPFDK